MRRRLQAASEKKNGRCVRGCVVTALGASRCACAVDENNNTSPGCDRRGQCQFAYDRYGTRIGCVRRITQSPKKSHSPSSDLPCAAAPAGTFKRLKFRNDNVSLVGDVNAVKELTKILVPASEAWWCVMAAYCVGRGRNRPCWRCGGAMAGSGVYVEISLRVTGGRIELYLMLVIC